MPDRLPRHALRRAGGFSLIELVITLAVLTILIGLALPSMGRLLGGSELTATVNELVFSLQSARSEAIKRASPVALCTSAAPLAAAPTCGVASYAEGWIVYADDDGDGTRGALEEVILQREPPGRSVTFTPEASVANQVLFVGSGASATAAGTPVSGGIRVEHPAEERALVVRIGANGRIASGAP